MPLTGKQMAQLADGIDSHLDLPALTLIAADLGENLTNLAPSGSLKERAFKLIEHMNGLRPPRDLELLEKLRLKGNAALRAIVDELLRPTFFSPTGDPHDAIVLGRTPFVARDDLRRQLREFTNPSPFTTRVLIVRGEEPGGKSYSWEFLRHLALSTGSIAQRLRLRNTNYSPQQFMEQVYLLLLLDPLTLPQLKDDPQLAKIDPLINAFKGRIESLIRPYWLVIDDLNNSNVTPAIREIAYAVAGAVEELKPPNLWVALLGYNEPILDTELNHVAMDDAEFPGPGFVAKHLELVSGISGAPLTKARAKEIADLLFAKFPKLNKETMSQLTLLVERAGEKLRMGLQP